MNRFLRTAPTRHVLGVLLGICAIVAAGATLAVAASGGGPVPPAKPLAAAIHQALAAPPVQGISATITWKNNLIDASELQGSDPLLSGGTGWLWASANHQFRLELAGDGSRADPQIVVDQNRFWAYDPGANTVYQGTIPAGTGRASKAGAKSSDESVPSVSAIEQQLKKLAAHLGISGAAPTDVGGQPAYSVQVTPRDSGGLIGGVQLAWDAVRGIPLSFSLYARGNSTPVLQLTATGITYGPLAASTFSVSPPSGATVVNVDTKSVKASGAKRRQASRHNRDRHEVTGASAVASHLPFSLRAPSSLGGLRLQSARLLDMSAHPAALLDYGQGLGTVVVLERQEPAKPQQSQSHSQSGDGEQSLTLPTIQVNGATATELDTALGTLVRFTRGGVSYTVAGSVPPAVADAVARGL